MPDPPPVSRSTRRRARLMGAMVEVVAMVAVLASCAGSPPAASHAPSTTSTRAGTGDTTSPTSTAPPCASAELRAEPGGSTATGTLPGRGVIVLTDTAATPCSVQGYLGIAVPARGNQVVRIAVVHDGLVGTHGFERAQVPARPPPVTIGPGEAAMAWIGVRWRSWCGGPLGDLGVSLVLPGDGGVVPVAPQGLWATATCARASTQNVLEEGPVQLPPS